MLLPMLRSMSDLLGRTPVNPSGSLRGSEIALLIFVIINYVNHGLQSIHTLWLLVTYHFRFGSPRLWHLLEISPFYQLAVVFDQLEIVPWSAWKSFFDLLENLPSICLKASFVQLESVFWFAWKRLLFNSKASLDLLESVFVQLEIVFLSAWIIMSASVLWRWFRES